MSWHLGSEKSSRKGALVITATLRETFAQQNVNLMSHSVFLRNRTPPIIALKMHHCHITSSNCDWWGGTYKQTTTKLTEIQSSSTKNTDFHVSRCVSHYWCKLLSFLSFDKHHLQQVNVLLAKATPHCIMATKKKKEIGEAPSFALLMQSAICLIVFSLCVSRLTATADPFSLFSRGCCDDEPHSGMKTDVRRKKSHLLVCHCGAQLHVRHVHCVKLFYFFLWSRLIAGLCWTVCVFFVWPHPTLGI